MLACSILVATIAAWVATAVPFALTGGKWEAYLLVPLSPGFLFGALIQPLLTSKGMFDFSFILAVFLANWVYWFVLIFGFVLWSDLRWRRKRAARMDP